ncbi:MAG TPA: hypothetical protein PLD82_01210 [Spirochaetota bacterium]|nr:hypothetical protein [Spirochaetota bacterium]HPH03661.1 hypothetical protein [Spirochaetota bacterium]
MIKTAIMLLALGGIGLYGTIAKPFIPRSGTEFIRKTPGLSQPGKGSPAHRTTGYRSHYGGGPRLGK